MKVLLIKDKVDLKSRNSSLITNSLHIRKKLKYMLKQTKLFFTRFLPAISWFACHTTTHALALIKSWQIRKEDVLLHVY